MSGPVDLRQLAVHRDEPAFAPRSRHWLTRYLLPGLVVLGFLGLVGWAARDSFVPARPVTVAPVLATRAEVQQAGAPLFVAAGWVEPRPTPILVTALAEGVIERLLVVEGQEVKADQEVAVLVAADAQLALAAAQADLRHREAEADAILARAETDLVFLPFQLQAAQAQESVLRQDLDNKKAAGATVIPALTIARVESEWITASARVEELKVRKQRLDREVATMKRMLEAFGKGESFHPADARALTDTETNLKAALTRAQQAQVALDAAKLRLERMTVRAPRPGRVLALVARPGSRLMGQSSNSIHDASTVISMYDPKQLQVRADVLFEDLPHLEPGQPVRIETPAVPGGPLTGELLFSTAITDIQKNTRQVKVAIKDPPPVLAPDMLVQLTFLAPQRADAQAPVAERLRLFVPRSLVEAGQGGARIWVADQTAGTARHRSIKLGRATGTDLVEVVEGLTAADKLIVGGREGLADGERIKVSGEDTTLGTSSVPGGMRSPKPQRLPGAGHEGKHE